MRLPDLRPQRAVIRPLWGIAIAMVALPVAAACGPGDGALEATVDARIAAALAAQPTITPVPSPTPAPTATPQPPPTPQPTATPQPPPPTATPFVFPTAWATPGPTVQDVYQVARFSVVDIRRPGSRGSGWAIEDGWIITNAHVVGDATSVQVHIPNANGGSRAVTGIVRGRDTRRDLAAIQVNHGAPVLATRQITARDAGLPVIQIGFSTGGQDYPAVRFGGVAAVLRHFGRALDSAPSGPEHNQDGDGITLVVYHAPSDPGDSGGPLLDYSGLVVGVVFGSVVSTGSDSQRVIGQQQAVGIREVEKVWESLKQGINTS